MTPSPIASHDPGALVPEDRRRVARGIGPGGRVHVRVAHPAGHERHEHLAGTGVGEVELLDHERCGELLEYGGANLHLVPPPTMAKTSKPYDRRTLRSQYRAPVLGVALGLLARPAEVVDGRAAQGLAEQQAQERVAAGVARGLQRDGQ